MDCSTPAGTRGWLWESSPQGGFETCICFFLLMYWGGREADLQDAYPLYWILMSLRPFAHEIKSNVKVLATARNEEKRVRR